MNIRDSIQVALVALRSNLLRSILTTLGIIIGVGSVIVMVAVGTGATSEVERQINALGSNMLVVFSGARHVGGRSAGAGTRRPLAESDLQAIRDKVSDVTAISGYLQGSAQVVRGNSNWLTQVAGVHAQYTAVRDWSLTAGREFDGYEVRSGSKVAILGATVVDKIFPGEEAIGQVLRIKNVPFTVIGVLSAKGQSGMGRDQDDVILLPMAAARGRIVGKSQVVNDQVGQVFVKFAEDVDLADAQAELEDVLRARRPPQADGEDDFAVRNLAEFMKARTATLTTMGWLLGATSAISLIVGGIGIMNIMLVSVTERTREIGLRIAVGGRKRDILVQFLIEAVALCLIGGLIGITLGMGAAAIVAFSAQWPVLINPQAVALALAAAAFTGIIFGFFPARRAANLNPIEALRSE